MKPREEEKQVGGGEEVADGWPWPSVAHWPQAAAARPVIEGFLCGVWPLSQIFGTILSCHSLGEDSDVCRDAISPIFHRCGVVRRPSGLTSTENEDLAKPEGPPGRKRGRSERMEGWPAEGVPRCSQDLWPREMDTRGRTWGRSGG